MRRTTCKLALEPLEDRLAPANIAWLPQGGSTDAHLAGNWQGGVVPGAADTAFFTAQGPSECRFTQDTTLAGVDVSQAYNSIIRVQDCTLTLAGNQNSPVRSGQIAAGGALGRLVITGRNAVQYNGSLLGEAAAGPTSPLDVYVRDNSSLTFPPGTSPVIIAAIYVGYTAQGGTSLGSCTFNMTDPTFMTGRGMVKVSSQGALTWSGASTVTGGNADNKIYCEGALNVAADCTGAINVPVTVATATGVMDIMGPITVDARNPASVYDLTATDMAAVRMHNARPLALGENGVLTVSNQASLIYTEGGLVSIGGSVYLSNYAYLVMGGVPPARYGWLSIAGDLTVAGYSAVSIDVNQASLSEVDLITARDIYLDATDGLVIYAQGNLAAGDHNHLFMSAALDHFIYDYFGSVSGTGWWVNYTDTDASLRRTKA